MSYIFEKGMDFILDTVMDTAVKPLINQKKLEKILSDSLDDEMEEVLKENLSNVLSNKKEEIKCGNYESILDIECRDNIVKEIIEKNSDLKIYKDDIKKIVQRFIDDVLKLLKNGVDGHKLLEVIIDFNHIAENKADKRYNDTKAEIKRFVYEEMNEKSTTNIDQLPELPFEVEEIFYKAEVLNGNIVYQFGFEVSKENYKVKLEDIFVASESKTGLWTFYRCNCFWIGHTTHQKVEFESKADGIRIIDSSAVVAFFKIYDCQSYYIRVFGDMHNLYYEQLTEKEYIKKREEYKEKYNQADRSESDFDDWRKYYASVMYTDFGR